MSARRSCQDYIIKDGVFIGAFEELYRDIEDPWDQSTIEAHRSEKAIALKLIEQLGVKRVLELGCGLGYFTRQIAALGVDVLGLDISETAIARARSMHPGCRFQVGDILDGEVYRRFEPELIVMAEVTWYVLPKLDTFLELCRRALPQSYLLHLLHTYPPGVQQYGRDKFTNLDEIRAYFGMSYLEWGEVCSVDIEGTRTYFLARWEAS